MKKHRPSITEEAKLSAPIEEEIPLPAEDELYEEPPREASYPEPEPPPNELLERAKNIETPAHELTSLFEQESFYTNEDSELHKLIASNPNTPKELLLKLGYRYPLQMMKNPSFELFFLENPAFFKEIPYDTRQAILREVASAPRWLIEVMIKGYASQLAQRRETPAWALSYIARAESSIIRYNAASNPSLPEEAMWHLIEDPEDNIRREITRNPALPKELALFIAQQGEPKLRVHLADNPAAKELWQLLAQDPFDAVRSSVARSTTDRDLLLALSLDESPSVVTSVAQNPNTPPELLMQLATHTSAAVRFGVTGNIYVRDNLFELVARAPNPISELLQKSSPEQAGHWRELYSLLSHPLDWSWARSSSVLARQIVARNTTNEQLMHELSTDASDEVRLELALNTKIQPKILERILPRLTTTALLALAATRELPLQVANALAQSTSAAPSKKTQQLAFDLPKSYTRDDSVQVRLALASNPYCAPSTIEILCIDSDPEVRDLAQTRRSYPEEITHEEHQEEPEDLDEITPSGLPSLTPIPDPDECLLEDIDEEELELSRFMTDYLFDPDADEPDW